VACTLDDVCIAGVCHGTSICPGDEFCNAQTGVCEVSPDAHVWVTAADDISAVFNGAMSVGTELTNGTDADPVADNLSTSLLFADSSVTAWEGGSGDSVTYTIRLPRAGVWYAWGRFYYSQFIDETFPNSFFIRVDGGEYKRFGNNMDFVEVWHWDGDGEVQSGDVAPLELGYLDAGFHRVVVEKREVGLKPPRLDMLLFTRDRDYRPTDAAALSILGTCGDGMVGPGEYCDDGPLNSNIDRYACRVDCTVLEVCGDANGDSFINATDAAVILGSAVGSRAFCGEDCDVNGDSRINVTDAFLVLRHSIGVDVSLTCGY
jgi:hypothetical protein